jgi:hypothetical protein
VSSLCDHAELLRQLVHERWRVRFAKRGRKWVAFCPAGHWVELHYARPHPDQDRASETYRPAPQSEERAG